MVILTEVSRNSPKGKESATLPLVNHYVKRL